MECNDFYDSQNLLKMLEDIVSLKKNEPNKYILINWKSYMIAIYGLNFMLQQEPIIKIGKNIINSF